MKMKSEYLVGTLTASLSVVRPKLQDRVRIEPESAEITLMHSEESFQVGYDPDRGVKIKLDPEHLRESIGNLRAWMKEKRSPVTFLEEPTFFLDVSDLRIDDIAVLEECGFRKKESENVIWEMY